MSKLPSPFNTQASGLVSIIQHGKLNPNISCVRASVASYMDQNGLPRIAGVNQPRMEYGTDGKFLGLLTEGDRTNVIPFSEEPTPTQSGWTFVNTAMGAVANHGDMKFTQIVESTTHGTHAIRSELRNLTAATYVGLRRFVKYDAGNPKAARFVSFVVVPVVDIVDVWYACHVDLTTGEYVTSQSSDPSKIEWFVQYYPASGITQVGCTFITPSNLSQYIPYFDVRFTTATKLSDLQGILGPSYVGTGKTLLSGGVHQENYSTTCSSYVRNTGGPSTRAADDIRLNNVPIGHDFTVYVECSKYSQLERFRTAMIPFSYESLDTGFSPPPRTSSIQITFRYDGALPMTTFGGSSSTFTWMAKPYFNTNNKFKLAVTANVSNSTFNWALDGSASTSAPRSRGIATANGVLHLGHSSQGGSTWFGHIQKIVAFPQAMTTEQLEFLTK